MLHPDDNFTANTEVMFTELGNCEGVLLHLGTQYYYSLNETGLAIWRGVTQGMSLGEVTAALQEEYDIDEAGAWQHVSSFVEHLKKMKLVDAEPGSVDRTR